MDCIRRGASRKVRAWYFVCDGQPTDLIDSDSLRRRRWRNEDSTRVVLLYPPCIIPPSSPPCFYVEWTRRVSNRDVSSVFFRCAAEREVFPAMNKYVVSNQRG